jgi:DNA-binding IclR family transcriptional regulator
MSQQTHDEGPSAAWGWGEENPPRSRSVTNKAATILKAFAGQSGRTMTEVAQDACLPASTAYRLLQELVSCGLLQRGADGRYHIGPAVYQLATDSCSPADDAQAHIGQILQDLELVTGYRARYGVLRGRGVGYVERGGAPPDWLRPAPAGGPAHATAAGQALLAHAGAEVIERFIHRGLPRYTSRTPVTAAELHQALSVVRKCEIAVTRGEWKETLCAIAAPVLLPGGRPAGALELTVPDAANAVRTTGPALLLAARTVARRLTESCSALPLELTKAPLRIVATRRRPQLVEM